MFYNYRRTDSVNATLFYTACVPPLHQPLAAISGKLEFWRERQFISYGIGTCIWEDRNVRTTNTTSQLALTEWLGLPWYKHTITRSSIAKPPCLTGPLKIKFLWLSLSWTDWWTFFQTGSLCQVFGPTGQCSKTIFVFVFNVSRQQKLTDEHWHHRTYFE